MTYLAEAGSLGAVSGHGLSLGAGSAGLAGRSALMMFQTTGTAIDPHDFHLLTVFVGVAAVSLAVLAIIVIAVLLVIAVLGLKAKAGIEKTVAEVKAKAYPIVDKTSGLIGDLRPTIVSITEKTNGLIGDLRPKIVNITEKADTLVGDLSPTVKSIVSKVDTLIGDLSPTVKGVAEDVHGIVGHAKDISGMVRDKVQELSPQVTEAVSATVDKTKETILQANQTVQDANKQTHQQIDRVNGVVTGLFDKTAELGESIGRGIKVPGREIGNLVTSARGKLDEFIHGARGFAASMRKGITRKRGPMRPRDGSAANAPAYESDANSVRATAAAAAAFEHAEKEDMGM